jgi:hypothetical protein
MLPSTGGRANPQAARRENEARATSIALPADELAFPTLFHEPRAAVPSPRPFARRGRVKTWGLAKPMI